ncbi:MAG: glycosyltransferase [Rhodobacterales bacterium]|nr:glycosyltransferase [Rhodobacterales bacterium]
MGDRRVGYVLNTYPQTSNSFIRREIAAIEARGWQVDRIAMRPDPAGTVGPEDAAEARLTHHVLAQGPLALMGALGRAALRHPGRVWRAARLAWACGGRAGGGRLRHLVYLAEAAAVADRARARGLTHLHAHFGTNPAMVAMLAHALGGPRFSFTVHGPEEFDAPLALSLPDKIAAAHRVAGVSRYGLAQLMRWCPPEVWPRLVRVPCGVDPARFAAPAPLPAGGPHLIAIGRLAPQKGFALLVQAMAQAAADLPDLTLTLVGDGPLRAGLQAQIDRAGLAGRIRLTGRLDEGQVRDRLAEASALILPSFAEGLPVVLMEAMAAGRPVIATAIAGIPELVEPGRNGWLVPAGDADALARAIADLAATPPDRLAQMGQAARADALARHDVALAAEVLEQVFA